ncbi:S9 family peptidase [Actinoallomurus purpureus]|uniref:S9 family peptidase n=1 Tax=Actinoallomurus purpureus TaxID=478114 RepID=UPI0020921735|nr:prolyl oligopeptidase family serine peptidase [Actinoallomurus purpureus]MCO6006591.1 S9 family peptidase [Actinoallomurus purpureus]
MTTSFPRQSARTRRFTLGAPRGFQVSPDGSRVVFLRTRGGTDPVTCLWTLDVPRDGGEAKERLIVDPRGLDLPGEEDLPAEERARRERAREQAGGVVTYATDDRLTLAAFALSGRLFVTDLDATVRPLDAAAVPSFDPRPDPSGTRVAYVSGGALRVIEVATGTDRALAEPDGEQVSYGLAEFIAAEEMQRMRGYWWAPDGRAILAARVDESPVRRWHIADPADPAAPPREVAYPAAGTPNADVSLVILGLDGGRQAVEWDREAFPYLVTARWDSRAVLLVVQTRDQKTMRILEADPSTGRTTLVREDTDPVWLDIVPGVPTRTGNGDLVWVSEDGHEARGLIVGDERVTPDDLHVRSVLDVDGDTVLFTASDEPTEVHVWAYGPGGPRRLSDGAGVFGARRRGGTTVIAGSRLDRFDAETTVLRDDAPVARIASHAEQPSLDVGVTLIRAGERELRTAVLLPTGYTGDDPLPVLMDPYGGPHAQRVLAARRAFAEPQWLADQGFAVVVADGRGTPGRGRAWERAVHRDLAEPVLDDQIVALRAAAERFPLDLSRVGIRGWSFGGYLAALAVLRRPDVFHAAIAGAPVTDWALYDTHYTERYLGHPGEDPEPYERCGLIGAVSGGEPPTDVTRPLLLIHGLADDNVVAAHTLRLSSALLAAGRPHSVLPLSGVTHMTPQEVVAENLLLLQIRFLKEALV